MCYLGADTRLPMMYITDCLRSVKEFLEVDGKDLSLRTYNVHAMSFTPAEVANAIQEVMPDFTIEYQPDSRQEIGECKAFHFFGIIRLIKFSRICMCFCNLLHVY